MFGFWILVLGFFLCGCARTVVPLPVVGNQITVNITFRGDIDSIANRYYLIFGSSSVKIPYTVVDAYFFAPGEDYDPDKLNVISRDVSYYYTNFFSSWSDFILFRYNNYYMTNGAFNYASASSYYPSLLTVRSTGSSSLNKISFIFDLSRLSAIPADLYFNLVAVGPGGYVKDYLLATDNKISTNQWTSKSGTDSSDSDIDSSLDIVSWDMLVQ